MNTPTPQPFDWFGPKSVKELYKQLSAVGPGRCRLEVYRNEKDEAMLQVRKLKPDGTLAATTAEPDPSPINDSFQCPPIC